MFQQAWRRTALYAAVLLVLNILLSLPLFLPGEVPFRDSIEGGYASMARFFSENPNPWGWNPTQYCGLPAQFTYLPALPYASAAIHSALPFLDVEYVHRLITATAACFLPVSVFLFVLYFTRSRGWAFAVALTYTLFSPLYGLVYQIDKDRGLVQLPWRIQVLVKYGEGPHTVSLALLPLAMIAIWRAATKPGLLPLLVAALLMTATALTNWVGSMTLAWCSVVLLLVAFFHRGETGFQLKRVLAAALVAYGLACFWITPSFVRVTLLNWPKDAFNYQFDVQKVYLMLAFLAAVLAALAVGWWLRRRPYLGFLLVAMTGFGFIVLNYYWYGLSTIPESRRYAVEFELFLLLALFEALRLVLASRRAWLRYAAMALAVWLFATGVRQSFNYIAKDHERWRPMHKEVVTEYGLSEFLASQKPRGRVYVSGGLRFRLNQWFSLPQVGGTFETGLRNRVPIDLAYQIRTGIGSKPGQDGIDSVMQLEVLGTEYVVVNGPKSEEYYRDFSNPKKFEGVLERVRREGDDTVYRVPFTSLAHLVRPEELPPYATIHGYLQPLDAYSGALHDSARPKLAAAWRGASRLDIGGQVTPGMLVSVSVNWDEGWDAEQDGQQIRVDADKWGLLVLHPKPAENTTITVKYHPSTEQVSFAVLSGFTWLGCLVLLWRERRSTATMN